MFYLFDHCYRRHRRATRIALELPSIRKKGVLMPNFELPNDEVVTITIKTTDSAGAVVPVPAGDTFSVVTSNPASLSATIGKDAGGNPALVLAALVQASPGLTVTVTDSAGLPQAILAVDIVPDVAPTNVILDLPDATHTTQAVPTAPGP